jgi:ornithine cyclodeaminase
VRIVELPEILAALDVGAALDAIEESFRRYSAGDVASMSVGYLGFRDPPGDCHVKGAHLRGDEVFAVKLATSFYRNPQAGLPTSSGFVAVMSARTGEMLAILHDRGQLTDQRTAMAGAIAARAIARRGSRVLGVIGAGVQARLQGELIARVLGLKTVLVWARNADRAAALSDQLRKVVAGVGDGTCDGESGDGANTDDGERGRNGVTAEAVSLAELCERADLIVTTTPSTEPILTAEMIRSGTRIVAVGADAPGKRELDVHLTARARLIVDSRDQCIDHGEAGWAVRAGLIEPRSLIELGEWLAKPVAFNDAEIVVADLTGLGIQDVQIAKQVWQRLAASS